MTRSLPLEEKADKDEDTQQNGKDDRAEDGTNPAVDVTWV